MARLSLSFLSTFQVTLDSKPITRFRSSNNQGLLVYLALQSERSFPREVLATLFWPEESESNARNNLRQSIYQLRKVLGDLESPGEVYLLVTRQTVQFNADSDFVLDVDCFLKAIGRGDLEAAVELYRGDLLPGFSSDSLQFEDWLRLEREHLHQVALEAMHEVTGDYLRTRQLDKAQAVARQQIALEPWREPAYHQLMQAYALAGDRSNALAQFEVCRDVLWDELGVEPAAETVALYESIKLGDYGSIAMDGLQEPLVDVRHNLPSYATPFIGRESDLAVLDGFITDPSVRLVTIMGPGGIGKTRLATEAAQRSLAVNLFADGLFFIDLAPLQETNHMVQRVADALNLPLQGEDLRSSRQQLLDYLRQKKLLLVFDNFENLLDGAGLLADILQSGPEIKILVTSRERLQLLQEQVYPIEGLAFPDLETAEDAAGYTAVLLFLQSAHRNQPDFSLRDDDDLIQLARICRMVEGMPLALELAAAWVDMLSLTEIANELQQGLDILERELRDIPARLRSVRASIDYSWQRLDEADRAVFAQLSIFRGGFTRQAAQEITGTTLRELSRLVNKSLVRFDKQRSRYEIHELLLQYGADKLGRQPALEAATCDRHSDYYCRFLAGYTHDLKGAGQAQAMSAIEADLENVRLAWNHASSQQDLEAIGMSLESLWRFYWNFGRRDVKEFETAVAHLRSGESVGARGIVLGRLLAPLGRFYGSMAGTAKARQVLEESLELLQHLNASDERLMPLLFLAEVQESIEESNRLYDEGLALAREIGDQWAIGHALLFLGWNARLTGDYQYAEQKYREALNQFRRNGDRGGIATALTGLSVLANDRGRYQDALAHGRESRSVTLGFNPMVRLLGLLPMGQALYALGQYKEAEELFQQIRKTGREFGREDISHVTLYWLGRIAFSKKDFTRATQQYQESLAWAVEVGALELIVQNHNALGRLGLKTGRGIEAREHFRAAMRTSIPLGRPPLILDCMAGIAELYAGEGDLEQAALLAARAAEDMASRAEVKQRCERLLARIKSDLSSNDLDAVLQRSLQRDLGTMANQLSVDLDQS